MHAGGDARGIAFGGPDKATLFVTDSTHGSVLKLVLDTPGVALHRGAPTGQRAEKSRSPD